MIDKISGGPTWPVPGSGPVWDASLDGPHRDVSPLVCPLACVVRRAACY